MSKQAKPVGPVGHNYETELLRRVREGTLPVTPGQCSEVIVLHDAWCPFLLRRGGRCTCRPEIRIRMRKGVGTC